MIVRYSLHYKNMGLWIQWRSSRVGGSVEEEEKTHNIKRAGVEKKNRALTFCSLFSRAFKTFAPVPLSMRPSAAHHSL